MHACRSTLEDPTAVDEVFQRVLHKKRDDRFQRAGDFAAALQRAIDRQSGQMPILKLPLSPALDGNWPEDRDEPMDLASAPEGPSGLYKTGVAGETDVDPSTKAEEAMEAAALEVPPPSLVAAHPSLVKEQKPASLISLDVKIKRSRAWWWLLLPLSVAGGGAAAFVMWPMQSGPKALVAPDPAAALPPRPVPQLVTIPAAPQNFPPEPIHKSTVQFTFHVVPKNADIRVDDRRVKAGKIALPWQEKGRKVSVTAPGFVPLNLNAESTESRVFELRMERVSSGHKQPKNTPPSHDAAPVQDL